MFYAYHLLVAISIHALREESDRGGLDVCRPTVISIHALREESDALTNNIHRWWLRFQSTLSARRATSLIGREVCIKLFQSTLSARRAT